MKYTVVQELGASCSDEVEADSVEDAINKADFYTTLCHHCSRNIEVSELEGIVVYDENDSEVYNDTYINNLEKKLKLSDLTNKIELSTLEEKLRLSTALNTRYYLKLDNALKTLEGIILKTQNNGGVFDLADLAVMVDSLDGDLDG